KGKGGCAFLSSLAPDPRPLTTVPVPYSPFPVSSLFYGAGAPENLSTSLRAWLEIPFFLTSFYRAALKAAKSADLIVGHWVLPMGVLASLIGRQRGVPYAAVAH